jgi:hypothetical protein
MHLFIPENFNSRIINTHKNHILRHFSSGSLLNHVGDTAQRIVRPLAPYSMSLFQFRARRTTGRESRFTDHAR